MLDLKCPKKDPSWFFSRENFSERDSRKKRIEALFFSLFLSIFYSCFCNIIDLIYATINVAMTNVNVHPYLPHQVDGHAAEMGPELDEEMEKVFAMDAGEKFDVARLGSPSESAGSDRDRDRDRGPPPRYGGDRDFNRKSLVDVVHFPYRPFEN